MGKDVEIIADIPQNVVYQACTVNVGTTDTLQPGNDATVTNVGTEYNAVLNFGIPRGKSAYEQAVEGGYTGTQEEFNAAIGTDVQTVSDNITSVNTAATNIEAIIDAPTQATNAATSASNAQKWAEGSDADVIPLGGTHSSKGWAEASESALSGKQDTLVSGVNIKTINSNSLLGSGDITIDSLPAQIGQSGKFLTTNGTTASWVDAPSSSGANTDLSNLTDTGKINACKMAAPSIIFEDLTLGTPGDTYTAPATGYVNLAAILARSLQLYNLTAGVNGTMFSAVESPTSYAALGVWLYVNKGDTFQAYYDISTPMHFRFFYAEGSKSEAS